MYCSTEARLEEGKRGSGETMRKLLRWSRGDMMVT